MNWFEQNKRRERREAVWFVINLLLWLLLGLGVLRVAGGMW